MLRPYSYSAKPELHVYHDKSLGSPVEVEFSHGHRLKYDVITRDAVIEMHSSGKDFGSMDNSSITGYSLKERNYRATCI